MCGRRVGVLNFSSLLFYFYFFTARSLFIFLFTARSFTDELKKAGTRKKFPSLKSTIPMGPPVAKASWTIHTMPRVYSDHANILIANGACEEVVSDLWLSGVFFFGYSSFLHHLQLASQQLSRNMSEKVPIIEIPNSSGNENLRRP